MGGNRMCEVNGKEMAKTLNMELVWFPVSKIVEKMVNKAGYK